MLRRIVGGVVLSVALVGTAHAQFSPVLNQFTLDSDGGTNINGTGFPGSVNDFFGHVPPTQAPNTFQVYCVDEQDISNAPLTYDAWYTSFQSTGNDYSHTLHTSGSVAQRLAVNSTTNGGGAVTGTVSDLQAYSEAAWLTTKMSGTADAANSGENAMLQYAIWEIMGYSKAAFPTEEPDYFAGQVYNAEQDALANWKNIDPTKWVIITSAPSDPKQEQEFIAQISLPQELSPEPGTMTLLATGLVGMAGAGLRRRKK